MKFLALLAVLPMAVVSLTEFADKMELIRCIQTCEEAVTPCIKDHKSACYKAYHKCLKDDDPFTCLSSANSLDVNKIARCFDEKCEGVEQKALDPEMRQDMEQAAQFMRPKGAPEKPIPTPPTFNPPQKVEIPILIQGHVVKFDEHGEPINEIINPLKPIEVEQQKPEQKQEEQEIKENA